MAAPMHAGPKRAPPKKPAGKRTPSEKEARDGAAKKDAHLWSAEVTEKSDAMTLEPDIFTRSAKEIARSVKRSAEQSHRRKSPPFRSAMSMLTFYANRAGKNLTAAEKKKLMQAKEELRHLFHHEKT